MIASYSHLVIDTVQKEILAHPPLFLPPLIVSNMKTGRFFFFIFIRTKQDHAWAKNLRRGEIVCIFERVKNTWPENIPVYIYY